MKDFIINFEVENQTYPAIFNLNVIEQIQDEYGTMKKWGELTDGKTNEVNVKALKFGIRAMINEAIEIENEDNGKNRPLLTLTQVGRIITRYGVEKSANTLNNAVIEAVKDDEPKN